MINLLSTKIRTLYLPKPPLNFDFFKQYLNGKIYISDVGATGGPERRWAHFFELCHFYAFDPDPRAISSSMIFSFTTFPVGLWSSKEIKPLHLTKFPSASTLFLFDQNLAEFLNHSCHEILNSTPIELEKMENLLQNHPPPDFLKSDAEGADLEILKGSLSFLNTSCMGTQVEVSFNPRHEGAPLFPEVDTFLRKSGFQLFDVSKQRWIRKNQTFDFHSKPQLIWGNAVYFLSKKEIFKRLETLSSDKQKTFLVKFLLLLIVYRFYDYAVEILECSFQKKIVDSAFHLECKKQIQSCARMRFNHFFRLLLTMGMGFFACLIFYPSSSLRSKAFGFFKGRVRQFSQVLLNLSRDGPFGTEVIEENDF